MNIWHNNKNKTIRVYGVVEIPKGSKTKYELDKETGMIILDRVCILLLTILLIMALYRERMLVMMTL